MKQTRMERFLTFHPTPFYVFDIPVLQDRIACLRQSLPSDLSLCYAMKANTFILPYLRDSVDRFEVCSPGELHIFRSQNLPAEKLVVSGIVKDEALLEELIRARLPVCAYTVESQRQFALLDRLSKRYRCRIPLLLRLTSGNQFGLNGEEIREIARAHKSDPYLEIRGIQYFSGTQKNSLKRLQREISRLDQFLSELARDSGLTVRELEFGPGLPVSYFPSDNFDESAFLREFSELLQSMTNKPEITLELGRSIAASCGTYCSRVVDLKTNNGQNYAILDGGIHHLVYYGQSMAMKQPFYELVPNRSSDTPKNWNLCGSLCTVNDILVKQLPICNLQIGDAVLFRNTGAYCMTEGISLFLSRNLPAVILHLPDGQLRTVRDALPTHPLNQPSGSADTEFPHTKK